MNKRNAPVKINPTDRPAELDELNFDDDKPTDSLPDTHESDLTTHDIGLTEASQPGQGPTNDDLTQETLILEDGARSPHEHGSGSIVPTDKTLSIVNENEIGAGGGLDEAELAEVDPVGRTKLHHKKQ